MLTRNLCQSIPQIVCVFASVMVLIVWEASLATVPLMAATCSSYTSGNWNNAGTWTSCNSGIPTLTDTVTINGGHTVTLDTDASVAALTINSGGTLQPDNPGAPTTRNLSVGGNFVNNGTFTSVNGNGKIDVTLNGSILQTLSPGSASFNNLTISTADSGLVGYWKFDEGSGSTANDSSGNSNTGTLNNSPTWTTVPTPSAPNPPNFYFNNPYRLSFNGSTNQYIGVANNSNLNFDGGLKFTLSAWITSSLPVGTNQPEGTGIIVKGNGSDEQYALDIDSGGCLRFSVRDSDGTQTSVIASAACPFRVGSGLVHVAGVFDRSQSLMQIYVNGSLSGTATPPSTLRVNTHAVSIGSRQSGSSDYDRTFTGHIDDVRIYNRALTSDEIFRLSRGFVPNATRLGGNLIVGGNLTLNSATLDVNDSNNYSVTVGGNFVNNCCLQPRSATFNFTGTGLHTLSGNTTRFYRLVIPDGVIVETGPYFAVFNLGGRNISFGTNSLGQLRHTPNGDASGNCNTGTVYETDGEYVNTIQLSGCVGDGFTSAKIRTAEGDGFPNVDLPGSTKYDTCRPSSNFVRRYWEITPNGTGARTANIIFTYHSSELNGNTPSTLHIYRCVSGTWVDQGLVDSFDTSSPPYYTAGRNGISVGSGYALTSGTPTAVKLASFVVQTHHLSVNGQAIAHSLLTGGLGMFALAGLLWLFNRSCFK